MTAAALRRLGQPSHRKKVLTDLGVFVVMVGLLVGILAVGFLL
jgi:hypothetical protein